jgi:hypothetical protein
MKGSHFDSIGHSSEKKKRVNSASSSPSLGEISRKTSRIL